MKIASGMNTLKVNPTSVGVLFQESHLNSVNRILQKEYEKN
jgi:hypothetical protein